MSEKPMFFFAGVYDDVSDAEADYEAIKALHAGDMIGSYDSAIISKDEQGKVKVEKTEKPTQHGGWAGLAAGAAIAVAAPVAMPVLVAAGGAGLGAWIGHLAHGMNRKDAKEIGEMLDAGTAALIVIGVDKDQERVEKTVAKATKHATKRLIADADEAEREALAVMASA
ncbi:MAG TPA: DUF1269 domain-containing protein [Solirubrobacteraceae bacterium]|nr:DUF1269 domain-containing protein [Solirubrobacteraceae bacterium]